MSVLVWVLILVPVVLFFTYVLGAWILLGLALTLLGVGVRRMYRWLS